MRTVDGACITEEGAREGRATSVLGVIKNK